MPQRAHRVVVSSAPVILHRKTRELVVLRVAFVVPRAVDEVHDVVALTVGGRAELRLRALALTLWHLYSIKSLDPLCPFNSHSTGTSAGAPLSLIKNTRNFAGLVPLAFRSTT